MFGLFQNSVEKKASRSARQFYANLLRWEMVIGPEKINSWLNVKKPHNFTAILNFCFKHVQIWEGLRILNKVAPAEYTTPFGKEIGQLMQRENQHSMKVFSDLSAFVSNDIAYSFNPTVPLAKWVLLNALSISAPTNEELAEATMDIYLASEMALTLMTKECEDFRFPPELIIKKYDPKASLDKYLLDIK